MNQAQQVGAKFIDFNASADYIGPGAIETPKYEDEILDIVRRSSPALQRMNPKRANGHPHRYMEQMGISQGAFTDPRNIAPAVSNPTRVERYAPIKALVNQTNLSLFDKEVTEQQGQFASVVGQDVEDIVSGIEIARAGAIWTGTDTSLTTPTTQQYMGLLSQINNPFNTTIGPGQSIIDGIKQVIARMIAQQGYVVRPSAVYQNPVLGDFIDREAKATDVTVGETEVVAGVTAPTIATRAGKLPFIDDPFIPADTTGKYGFSAPPAGYENYYAVVVMESLIEMPYVSGKEDNPNPRLFQLGLTGNLSGQYVGVKFDTIIAKGATYAHAIICVQRPTAE